MAVAAVARPVKRGRRFLVMTMVAIALFGLGAASANRDRPTVDERVRDTASLDAAEFEAATGIRIVRVVVTAGGGLLDLRYQILDPDKALVVHDAERPPALRREADGVVLAQAWHRHKAPRGELGHARIYQQLLINRGGAIRPGDRVSVLVGDWRLEDVTVL